MTPVIAFTGRGAQAHWHAECHKHSPGTEAMIRRASNYTHTPLAGCTRYSRKRSFPRLAMAAAGAFLSAMAMATEHLATLNHRLLPEASGLAVSAREDARVWFINDSGNRAELIAFDWREDRYQRIRLKNTKNKDWEDLAAFEYGGNPWLAVGDIGDNKGKRGHIKVHLLPEPALVEVDELPVHTTLKLRYPEKARDAESMAIDSRTQTLYLLSKREKSPRLYSVELPSLEAGGEHELDLVRLGKVKSIPKPSKEEEESSRYGKYRAQPTSMAFLHDPPGLAVLTYGGPYVAMLGEHESWLDALNENLCRVEAPELKQGETIATDSQGRIYLSSEGRRAPLLRIQAACKNRE